MSNKIKEILKKDYERIYPQNPGFLRLLKL